ncbi:MAG: hypothetical protein PWQ79_638 [Thermococcaceae archaeon]|nr:hypothetical protein [Thermococcaceae archaeon]MDK2913723.1 hypothetical protein [Thermococcaceae archaeon]
MKKILGLVILFAGMLIAVTASSANFAYFHADRNVHIQVVPDDNELIDLEPLQPYAYINSNGMLVIDLSEHNANWEDGLGKGVSPNSTYVFEEVFGVTNHLWENMPICMHITYTGADEVTFFEGDYVPGVTTGASELIVTVMPGDVVRIGLIIDSSGVDAGSSLDGQIQFYAEAGECPTVE